MYKKHFFFFSFLLYLCFIRTNITDDYIELTLRISSDSIIIFKVGQKFQFTAKYFDTSGTPADNPNLIWTVSPPGALGINDSVLRLQTAMAKLLLRSVL